MTDVEATIRVSAVEDAVDKDGAPIDVDRLVAMFEGLEAPGNIGVFGAEIDVDVRVQEDG